MVESLMVESEKSLRFQWLKNHICTHFNPFKKLTRKIWSKHVFFYKNNLPELAWLVEFWFFYVFNVSIWVLMPLASTVSQKFCMLQWLRSQLFADLFLRNCGLILLANIWWSNAHFEIKRISRSVFKQYWKKWG